MKRGLIFIGLFMISLLVISGCEGVEKTSKRMNSFTSSSQCSSDKDCTEKCIKGYYVGCTDNGLCACFPNEGEFHPLEVICSIWHDGICYGSLEVNGGSNIINECDTSLPPCN